METHGFHCLTGSARPGDIKMLVGYCTPSFEQRHASLQVTALAHGLS
jgi:hypothetical protein